MAGTDALGGPTWDMNGRDGGVGGVGLGYEWQGRGCWGCCNGVMGGGEGPDRTCSGVMGCGGGLGRGCNGVNGLWQGPWGAAWDLNGKGGGLGVRAWDLNGKGGGLGGACVGFECRCVAGGLLLRAMVRGAWHRDGDGARG